MMDEITITMPERRAPDVARAELLAAASAILETWDAYDATGPAPLDSAMERLRTAIRQATD